jgi:serine/threonine protein kinase/WD40 repeat protein
MTKPHDDQTVDDVPAAPQPAPAGIIASVADLEASLTALQLLDAQQQTEMINLRGKFAEPKALARELLQRDWLTPFQVNQLFQGKGRDLALGPYVLLERIGEGGMGAVYKARNQFMKRLVAIKLIRKDRLANPDVVQRFYREIQAAAQVQHPNIVVAYHADRLGEVHFLVMEYVEGGDLAKEVKKRGPLPIAEACDYIRQAALGLHHAHERGLVHRDIKPGNLLLSRGVIKVLDLGLARLSVAGGEQPEGELTHEGMVMGTPDYIAPEQAYESHTVDARADVYSLGCTLYYLLSGTVPFPGGTLVQKMMKHQREEPPPLTSHRAEVPPGLVAVVARMMAKLPEARYQSAAHVALALEPFCGKPAPVAVPLAGITLAVPVAIPLTASPPVASAVPMAMPLTGDASSETPPPGSGDSSTSWTEFILRKLKLPDKPERRRWVLAGAGGVVVLFVLLLLLLRSPKKPEPQRQGLETIQADNIADTNRIKGQPKHLVGVLGEHRLRHDMQLVTTVAVSPTGKVAATVAADGFLRLSNPETLVEQKRFDLREAVPSLAFSHDGKYLAAGTTAGFIRLYDIEAGKELAPLRDGHSSAISQIAFSPRDYRLVSASNDTTVGVWDAAEGKRLYSFKKHTTPVNCVAISADGKQVASGAGDNPQAKPVDCEPIMWSIDSGEIIRKLNPGGVVRALAYSPDGTILISVDGLQGIRWWDEEGKRIRSETPPGLTNPRVQFSPDSKRFLYSTDTAPNLTLWETATGRNIRPARLQVNTTCGVFMPDSRRALLPSYDTLRVWDVFENVELMPTLGHTRPVTHLQLFDDNRTLISGGLDGLRRWDLEKRTDRLFEGSGGPHHTVSPSMRYALSVSPQPAYQIKLWDLENGKDIRSLTVPGFSGFFAYFLNDHEAVFDSKEGSVIVWDVLKNQEAERLQIFPDGVVVSLIPSPDGKYWLARGSTGSVGIWDREQKTRIATWPAATLTTATFSPDSKQLYYGNSAADVSVIDLPNADGKAGQTFFRLHRSPIQQMALSPDGKTLVTTDTAGHVVLWDATRRGDNKLEEWDQPTGPVTSLCFADNQHLFMGNTNGTIYILRLPPR